MTALTTPFTAVPVTTARGIAGTVRRYGEPGGSPLVFFHGAGGLLATEPVLERLAGGGRTVYAPEWPGFGTEPTEERLDDMLDFTLHGWDLVEALGLGDHPVDLLGHSMGGMIAAEMACVAPRQVRRLVLLAPVGLWLDAHPVPDLFGTTPLELPALLFADPAAGMALLTGGLDFGDDAALTVFMVANARRLGTAGKILFPIPDRGLAKRLYRVTAPVQLVWGAQDRLVPPVYGHHFAGLLPQLAALEIIDGAGHMVPYEQPYFVTEVVERFLR